MHPALSVIFFTTLSGAGYGLLVWLGITIAMLHTRSTTMQSMHTLQLATLALGLALSTIGLLCSLLHLGKPQRAWRALSQWRTSWLSREGLLALLTVLPALAIGVMLLTVELGPNSAPTLGLLGFALAVLALATVACTAMIYASLKPIPAWRHALVVPVYLLFALLTGLALLFLLMNLASSGGGGVTGMLATTAFLAALLVASKWLYWRDIDRTPLPATRADAVGLPGREVGVFEHPHTQANYITREMAFVIARDHALRLRIIASALVLGVPLLAWGLAFAGVGHASWLLGLAALGTLAGAFVERWLFFAQARHMVSLYY
ncbi:MAG: dimethyl sulfoxide reductase anchor subunit [Luteimonas sp.]|nr:dimethyl sulfoxide reductase anchor subunit [Luteimonas sp.]